MNPGAPEDTSTNDAQSCYVQRYLQKQINYVERQLSYSQKLKQHNCPYIWQKVECEVHRQKPERCKNCLVWEREQFQKIEPLNTRKFNL